jgi:hypothetical protein
VLFHPSEGQLNQGNSTATGAGGIWEVAQRYTSKTTNQVKIFYPYLMRTCLILGIPGTTSCKNAYDVTEVQLGQ